MTKFGHGGWSQRWANKELLRICTPRLWRQSCQLNAPRVRKTKGLIAMASKRLAGKVGVVTGASKGIGAAIAKQLAAEGASVVVNYASSKEGAEQVVNEITKEGGKAVAIQGDVAKSKDVERLFAETKKAFGRLDILVNNAGVYQFSSLEETTEEQFQRMFGINVLGLIQSTREALKYFGPEGGSVINIGSTVSSLTPPTTVVYTATKGAVDAVTRVLAKELGPKKIRVNSINPGMVETEGVQALGILGSDFEKDAIAQTPLGRIGQPGDIAPVVSFLASPESAWVTGELLQVAGGLR
jgi:3-oxoacyl-[acyl-carrier protein] reductase